MVFSGILNDIYAILEFVLSAFSKVIDFANSNPILAISIYVPFVTFLFYCVFDLLDIIFNHKKKD